MARKRDKIKFCLDDYLETLSHEERSKYLLENTALISIIHTGASDEKIMSEAKRYDEENNTDLFSEVILFRVYCIACHKVECDC
ncbi:hypothetical protein [Desulfopila inferna]|uniref:hypothetical protein n=1 Tax=Desulfopila inferna TaxID=468528 RepID=UPI001964D843|nr:hypothetical protein [Desulfopila inferna]MBM9604945.1 hypothetical protein [Desulfopila inferna]